MTSLTRAKQTDSAVDEKSRVLTEALLNSANLLGITRTKLAEAVGVSDATMARIARFEAPLKAGTKTFEFGVMIVRIFRSLDAIVAGDEASMKSWRQTRNIALGARPLDLIAKTDGIVHVLDYLDARRAPI